MLNWGVNLREVSNAIALWLDVAPAEIMFYALLPAIVTPSAMRTDFYMFSKTAANSCLAALLLVLCITLVLSPFFLFALGYINRGWSWFDTALFCAAIAPTDALAAASVVSSAGGPDNLLTMLRVRTGKQKGETGRRWTRKSDGAPASEHEREREKEREGEREKGRGGEDDHSARVRNSPSFVLLGFLCFPPFFPVFSPHSKSAASYSSPPPFLSFPFLFRMSFSSAV